MIMDVDSKRRIGAIIRAARTAAGLTQRQLGELCGYPLKSAENTVQRWEYGQAPVPAARLKPLSRALGIPVVELIP